MKYVKLGNSGIDISAIMMGTWQMGKSGFRGRSQWLGIEDSESLMALRGAYDAGITSFDTAFIYGEGHSEKILGQALAQVREKIVIASKMHPLQCARDQVFNSCHRSLKNLRTDYIDLYQIHFPSGMLGGKVLPIEETMSALLELKEQGKIRAIGVSNFTLSQLKEALICGNVDSLQSAYSLFWRHAEKNLIPFCAEKDITVLAYSPLAQGLLTGKFGKNLDLSEGDNRLKNKLFLPPYYSLVQEALEKLRPLAVARGVTLSEIALAWLVSHAGCAAIAGGRYVDQVSINAQASDLELTAEEIKEMEEASSRVSACFLDDPMMWV